MLDGISYLMILGKPLIFWMGVLTLGAILLTAAIPLLNKRGIRALPFSWHPRCAALAIILALTHGTLGMLAYL